MEQQLQRRVVQLEREISDGQRALAELDRRRAQLRDRLLRLSGAAQVLQEELDRHDRRGVVPIHDRPGLEADTDKPSRAASPE